MCVYKIKLRGNRIGKVSYRLLNRDDIFEKKLVRPECGESPVWAPEPEYSKEALFRVLVWPANNHVKLAISFKYIHEYRTNCVLASSFSAIRNNTIPQIELNVHFIQIYTTH